MNSLIEDKTLPNNLDQKPELPNSSKGKLLNKPYSFFIFYKVLTTADRKLTSLEVIFNIIFKKLSFRLREEKPPIPFDKYLDKNERNEKLINLFFANLDHESDLETSFMDLKFHIVESMLFFETDKTKIIILGYESDLLRLIDKTSHLGIDIKTIPFAIYSPTLNDDLALFLGTFSLTKDGIKNKWVTLRRNPLINCLCWPINGEVLLLKRLMFGKFTSKENKERSPIRENGKISKLEYDFGAKSYFLKEYENILDRKDYFMSHFSVGYHSKMFMEFETSKKIEESSFFSRMKFGFEGFKQFCCVGNHSMKTSTGIVNISFKDEKNSEMEIMKEFYDQEDNDLSQEKKYKHNRKVLSIVLANIDTYYGQKLSACRMNDTKIELLSFDSKKEHQKIGSIGGEIELKFETEQEVCLKIGDSFYVLEHPVEAVIKQYTKMKALINKETVGC